VHVRVRVHAYVHVHVHVHVGSPCPSPSQGRPCRAYVTRPLRRVENPHRWGGRPAHNMKPTSLVARTINRCFLVPAWLSPCPCRFYIMRLPRRGLKFHRITYHAQCTQCLGGLNPVQVGVCVVCVG
jgi:hypothetical protein